MRPGEDDKAVTAPQASQEARAGDLSETLIGPQSSTANTPAPTSTNSAEAWLGKTLGKYQVTRVLGVGGMGVVLKAHDPLIERDVAIKVLADHTATDPTALGRFLAEAKAVGFTFALTLEPEPAYAGDQSSDPFQRRIDNALRHGLGSRDARILPRAVNGLLSRA